MNSSVKYTNYKRSTNSELTSDKIEKDWIAAGVLLYRPFTQRLAYNL
jgi:hypothetical protein